MEIWYYAEIHQISCVNWNCFPNTQIVISVTVIVYWISDFMKSKKRFFMLIKSPLPQIIVNYNILSHYTYLAVSLACSGLELEV